MILPDDKAIESYNQRIDKIRQTEYPQLLHSTYLDHAGTTLYPQSLIDTFSLDLKTNLFGNPHSASPSSDLSTQRVEQVRQQVLDYFNSDPEFFDVIFVANASAAIKLVLHAFAQQGYQYGYHRDCHTSMVGGRESAATSRYFVSDEAVEAWIDSGAQLDKHDEDLQLFAYPAQSNMTGHRPSLSWIKQIRTRNPHIYVLLDAASYLTSGKLDFWDHDTAPDFTALSFYKIFGFPDLGALIVRKASAKILLARRYFGGGTVDMIVNGITASQDWHAPKSGPVHEVLEDGTLPFHNIIAVGHAMRIQSEIFGDARTVRLHTASLATMLYDGLLGLSYRTGGQLVRIYKDEKSTYGDTRTQGPILAFNVLDKYGKYIGKSRVEAAAIVCRFQLRTGGVCNPGGIASILGLEPWEMRRNFTDGMRCGDDLDVIGEKPTGVVRLSLGPMSTRGDVDRIVSWMKWWFIDAEEEIWDKAPGENLTEWDGRIEVVESLGRSKVEMEKGVNYEALKGWERDWVILEENPTNNNQHPLVPSGLVAILQPEEGILRFASTNNADLDDTYDISLWDTPYHPVSDQSHRSPEGRKPERCANGRINEWLSAKLGSNCYLARYESRYAKPVRTASTCTKAGCWQRIDDEQKFRMHLQEHARVFEEVWQVQTRAVTRSGYRMRLPRDATALVAGSTLSIDVQEVKQKERQDDSTPIKETNVVRRITRRLRYAKR